MLTNLLLLILPVVEYLFLRLWIRDGLGIQVGWFSMTDYEFYLPCLVAFFLLFFVLEQAEKKTLRPTLRGALLHGLCLGLFCLFNLACYSLGLSKLSGGLYLAWWALVLPSFATSFFILVEPRFFLANPNRWVVFPASLIALSFPIYMEVLEPAWGFLYPAVVGPACYLLSAGLGSDFQCALWPPNASLLHPKLNLILGAGCSGLEGATFALVSFNVFYLLRRSLFSPSQWLLFAALDLFLFYWVNVLRIVGIFLFGVLLDGSRWSVELFHWHIGWIGYAAIQTAYLSFLSRLALSSERVPFAKLRKAFSLRPSGQTLLVLYALFSCSFAVSQSCTFEPCSNRLDCDAGCPCEANCDCVPCANLSSEADCEDITGLNQEVCEWVGGVCQQISAIGETQDSLRFLLVGLACLVPFSIPFLTRRHSLGSPSESGLST